MIPFDDDDDALIIEMKGENLGWDVIEGNFAEKFLHHSKSRLQVRYSSKLRRLSRR